jgi:hypothetical protein
MLLTIRAQLLMLPESVIQRFTEEILANSLRSQSNRVFHPLNIHLQNTMPFRT